MGIGEAADLYKDVERELCRIPEVTAARIVTGAGGRPTEVHVLASAAKHAKQVVRDVQSVAMATFGLDLDRRIISVVQLDGGTTAAPSGEPRPAPDAPPAATTPAPDDSFPPGPRLGEAHRVDPPPPTPPGRAASARPVADATPARSANGTAPPRRVQVEGTTAQRQGTRAVAQVCLRRGEATSVAAADGVMTSTAVLRLVAAATLDALRELEPDAADADVELASIVRLGDRPVALVTLVFVLPPDEEVVTGSAPVRATGEADAVARAVLDATNRRLGRRSTR